MKFYRFNAKSFPMEVLISLLKECAQPKISIVFFRQDRSYDEIIIVISRGHETAWVIRSVRFWLLRG